MKIEISTTSDEVMAAAVESNNFTTSEVVIAKGKTLTEAIENLMLRFGELRNLALQELRDKAFVRTEGAEESMS